MEENGIKTLQIIDDAKEFITSKKVFFNELLEDQSIFDGQKSKMWRSLLSLIHWIHFDF